jgi:hypothetical protein
MTSRFHVINIKKTASCYEAVFLVENKVNDTNLLICCFHNNCKFQ